MSKKKHTREPNDYYGTPPAIAAWTVDHCLDLYEKHNVCVSWELTMLEPGCGKTFPFAKAASRLNMSATATDLIDYNSYDHDGLGLRIGFDFLGDIDTLPLRPEYDIIATNPPFKHGIEFVKRGLELLSTNGVMGILQKMSFMNSQSRYDFFKECPPVEIHVLSLRPSFTQDGKTDGQEYALYFWAGENLARKITRDRGQRTSIQWQNNKEWTV